jgi:superfamily II DNA or RNA helicase
VLINVHRRELADQACNRLREFGVGFGLIMAGEEPRKSARVQVASVQTLIRRECPPAGLVICDEAHLSTAKTWQTILDQYPRAWILGVTATPWRLGGKPLSGSYDATIVVSSPDELRRQGHLCPYVGFAYKAPDLSQVGTVGGEYNEQQSAAAMRAPQLVANVVEQWLAHASHLSTVVFAVTVEHSLELTAQFRAAGVTAEHLDGSTPLEARRATLRRIDSGVTKVLCNVGIAVEGLDIPRLKCCVLARPTMSLTRAIQMMGRVRRPWNDVTARIHDHAFVIERHGLPDQERDYSLHARNEDPPSLTTCPKCLALFSGSKCPSCGEEKPREAAERAALVTIPDAEREEFSSEDTPRTPASDLPPVSIAWTTPGRVIEGVYEGATEEGTIYGWQKRYTVLGTKRRHVLPGTSQLDARMRKVDVGAQVRITFRGVTSLPNGKQRKEFSVEVEEPEPEEDSRKEQARKMYTEQKLTLKEISKKLGVSKSTIYRWVVGSR